MRQDDYVTDESDIANGASCSSGALVVIHKASNLVGANCDRVRKRCRCSYLPSRSSTPMPVDYMHKHPKACAFRLVVAVGPPTAMAISGRRPDEVVEARCYIQELSRDLGSYRTVL
jgi:hypothetical protein